VNDRRGLMRRSSPPRRMSSAISARGCGHGSSGGRLTTRGFILRRSRIRVVAREAHCARKRDEDFFYIDDKRCISFQFTRGDRMDRAISCLKRLRNCVLPAGAELVLNCDRRTI
jgi:hypothetical protein